MVANCRLGSPSSRWWQIVGLDPHLLLKWIDNARLFGTFESMGSHLSQMHVCVSTFYIVTSLLLCMYSIYMLHLLENTTHPLRPSIHCEAIAIDPTWSYTTYQFLMEPQRATSLTWEHSHKMILSHNLKGLMKHFYGLRIFNKTRQRCGHLSRKKNKIEGDNTK